MRDEEVEDVNASYGSYEYCRVCDDYVMQEDFEAHVASHERDAEKWDWL